MVIGENVRMVVRNGEWACYGLFWYSKSPSPQLPKCAGVPGSWGLGELADFVYSTPQVRRRAGSWGVGNLQSCKVDKKW